MIWIEISEAANDVASVTKSKKAPKIGDLILCEWRDSYGCSSVWQTIEPDAEPQMMTCKSVGWLIRQSRNCIVVVPHISANTQIAERQGCGDMTIPTTSIVRIEALNASASYASLEPSLTRPRS